MFLCINRIILAGGEIMMLLECNRRKALQKKRLPSVFHKYKWQIELPFYHNKYVFKLLRVYFLLRFMKELSWLKLVHPLSKEKILLPRCRITFFLFDGFLFDSISKVKCLSIPEGKAFWHWCWKRGNIEVHRRLIPGRSYMFWCNGSLASWMMF